jgi:hypothetical protein
VQGYDVIKVVAPFGCAISEVGLFPDAAAVLAGTARVLAEPGRSFHAARRHNFRLRATSPGSVGERDL